MTENISQAISEKKIAFFKWKQNGRPPDPNNPFTIKKKITTSSLRKQCRVEAALHRIQERQKIIDARYNDPALFYSLIKKQRGKLSRFIEELTVDEEIFQSPVNVMKGWNKHFGDLAKKSNNNSFDTKYLNSIEKEATHIIKMCKDKYKHQEITTGEIKKAVSKLNTNKAEDFYGFAEHFIHGSESLLQHLQQLLNVCFKFCFIPDLLKIGTLFPVFKNKGDIKNAKNYRGITITPTYSKIIENILKGRENPKIIISQNPLQKGFTEGTSPLICELFIEEFERESKYLKLPVYIALLDGKSFFDVVVHANLIRRFGGRVGNINCCAPKCADDVTLVSNNPLELQTMINIALDFSKREGYLLQPTKSVVIPVKTCRKFYEIEDGFWKLNGKNMPIVPNASHIGIQKSDKDSADTTVNENIKKARRAMYSLMGTGLPSKTSISLIRIYILPILTYGLELLLPKGKILYNISIQYKKWIKQILSLNSNVADSAVYTLSGLLPIEAEIHVKAINLFGKISRAKCDSIEWRLAERQLQIKPHNSHS
ncbi:unnamed protein product [Mytilus coruscus]|uniref:Reverse transcriptase domain-containing protein n=1 Tax=Mytilus coruscus TaxID=42192 RepID=A0A6J8A3K5_MYTCO|nr:unnamed protein product [Mytilus coruscus]